MSVDNLTNAITLVRGVGGGVSGTPLCVCVGGCQGVVCVRGLQLRRERNKKGSPCGQTVSDLLCCVRCAVSHVLCAVLSCCSCARACLGSLPPMC